MTRIQAIASLLVICTFLSICSSEQKIPEALDDSSDDERRSVGNEYFDQFLAKRTSGRRMSTRQICSGNAACGDQCDQGQKYDSSTTCGLVCYSDPFKKGVGETGTCHTSSDICPHATSTFCPGGTFTIIRNTYPRNPTYYDCDNGYGCGQNGGCCVRIAGWNTGRNKHFCLTCNTAGLKKLP